ncbi:MAG: hypothetical protein ACK559_34750, partial [bacterium]
GQASWAARRGVEALDQGDPVGLDRGGLPHRPRDHPPRVAAQVEAGGGGPPRGQLDPALGEQLARGLRAAFAGVEGEHRAPIGQALEQQPLGAARGPAVAGLVDRPARPDPERGLGQRRAERDEALEHGVE